MTLLPLLGEVVGFTPRLTKTQLCDFRGVADDCSSGTRNYASDWIILIVRMFSINRLNYWQRYS